MIWIHSTMCYLPSWYDKTTTSCPVMTTLVMWDVGMVILNVFVMFISFIGIFFTALCYPSVVTSDSFLINHSIMYTTASLASVIEFWIRQFFIIFILGIDIPSQYVIWYKIMSCIGLVLVLFGQWLRSCAMMTASKPFHHYIQINKHDNHHLITQGVYAYIRHPSYMGFFLC
jgi:protein-S-isoprenylcysteine O-methyltransferase